MASQPTTLVKYSAAQYQVDNLSLNKKARICGLFTFLLLVNSKTEYRLQNNQNQGRQSAPASQPAAKPAASQSGAGNFDDFEDDIPF